MSTLIETAGQTAMESVNEVNNASSVELTNTLKVEKDCLLYTSPSPRDRG